MKFINKVLGVMETSVILINKILTDNLQINIPPFALLTSQQAAGYSQIQITRQMAESGHFDIRNIKQLSRGLKTKNLDFDFESGTGRELSNFYHTVIEER